MARLNAANNARSTLASGIAAGATSLSVASAASFPAAPFMIVVFEDAEDMGPSTGEIMRVTAVDGTTFTVTRAQEGTSAQAFLAGVAVWNVWTKGTYHELAAELDQLRATAYLRV